MNTFDMSVSGARSTQAEERGDRVHCVPAMDPVTPRSGPPAVPPHRPSLSARQQYPNHNAMQCRFALVRMARQVGRHPDDP
jgi:hypothetical protein